MIALLLLVLGAVPSARAGPRLVPAEHVDEAGARELFRGQRLALLVGPADFDGTGFQPLHYTSADALALQAVLTDPAQGTFDRVWTLTSPEQTDRAHVRRAMEELAQAIRSPDDTVFVYFSTHGSLARDDQGHMSQYLVLEDSRIEDLPGTALSQDELLDWLDGLRSRRKVLLLATCHSGQGKSALPTSVVAEQRRTKGPLPPPPLREVSEAEMIIGVCAWDETAQESEALGHDIYTWYFLEGLKKGDLDGDGAVTATEAHEWARRRTYIFTQGAQRPFARSEILGSDPVVLVGHPGPAQAATVSSWGLHLDGYRVRVDGLVKGELPGVVVVERGVHTVELLDQDRVVARQRLRLDGGPVDAGRLLHRDLLRFGVGAAWQGLSAPGAGGGALTAELDLPRWPGAGWEIASHGSAVLRWPSPTVEGGISLERRLSAGALQPRLGGGLEGFLLGASGSPPLLAPSLVPEATAALVWLPRGPAFARLDAGGGYLWFANQGVWNSGWTVRGSLVVGGRM